MIRPADFVDGVARVKLSPHVALVLPSAGGEALVPLHRFARLCDLPEAGVKVRHLFIESSSYRVTSQTVRALLRFRDWVSTAGNGSFDATRLIAEGILIPDQEKLVWEIRRRLGYTKAYFKLWGGLGDVAYCHYTEYDAVPLKRGYVEGLRLAKDTVPAGESHPESPGFRIWHEECRYRAVEVIGNVLNVPVSIAYGFGPSLILGADCVGYLGRFDEEDFERHIHPALERIKSDHVYDEVILMSLLVGRGFRREFNPAAKFIMCKACDSATIERASRDPQAFAVHAVKSALAWEPISRDDACLEIGKLE